MIGYTPQRIEGEIPAELEPLVEQVAEAYHDDHMAEVAAKTAANPRVEYTPVIPFSEDTEFGRSCNDYLARRAVLAILQCGWRLSRVQDEEAEG